MSCAATHPTRNPCYARWPLWLPSLIIPMPRLNWAWPLFFCSSVIFSICWSSKGRGFQWSGGFRYRSTHPTLAVLLPTLHVIHATLPLKLNRAWPLFLISRISCWQTFFRFHKSYQKTPLLCCLKIKRLLKLIPSPIWYLFRSLREADFPKLLGFREIVPHSRNNKTFVKINTFANLIFVSFIARSGFPETITWVSGNRTSFPSPQILTLAKVL